MSAPQLDPTSDRPLSSQLADMLRDEILSGARRPGSQLPTESGFQNDYGVSRTTVRAALRDLIGQGLVVSRKGYGSFVRDQRPIRRISAGHKKGGNAPVFDTAIRALGHEPSRRMLFVGRAALPADIAELLELPRMRMSLSVGDFNSSTMSPPLLRLATTPCGWPKGRTLNRTARFRPARTRSLNRLAMSSAGVRRSSVPGCLWLKRAASYVLTLEFP